MVNRSGIVALVLLLIGMVNRSLALTCIACEDVNCGPPPTCSYGITKGVCPCCDVCAKGPGESCGGVWNFGGTCMKGLECTWNYYESYNEDGVCVETEQIYISTTTAPFANEFTIGNQTFAVMEDHLGVSWDAANSACIEHGYDLAEPDDLVSLARYLNQNYGYTYYWLGGHSTGSPDFNVKWLSGPDIPRSSLWRPEYQPPGDYCVYLRDDGGSNPIGSHPCSDTNYLYPLCEAREPTTSTDDELGNYTQIGAEWFMVVKENMSWPNAREHCKQNNGDLASPKNLEALKDYLKEENEAHDYWLGGTDEAEEGKWSWLSGGSIVDSWKANQPSGGKSQNCLDFRSDHIPSLNDYECDEPQYFICEKELCRPSPCGRNTNCKVRNDRAVCSCIDNYLGDPLTGCQPECVSDSECPSQMACSNNRCINPCIGACGEGALCDVVQGRARCSCPQFYQGSPVSRCYPECTAHDDCPSYQVCYQLQCVNPCEGACGQGAECKVENHKLICFCPKGYFGNPFESCRPFIKEDFCRDNPCGFGADCTPDYDRDGNYRPVCTCPRGFIGNPLISCQRGECERHDDCMNHRACYEYTCQNPCYTDLGSVCGDSAECTVKNHHPVCSCPPGYDGNPLQSCSPRNG